MDFAIIHCAPIDRLTGHERPGQSHFAVRTSQFKHAILGVSLRQGKGCGERSALAKPFA